MKQVSGRELCVLLKQFGWELKRINGSHHIFTKENRPERISVPVHGNTPLKKGLLLSIMKIAGIVEKDL